MRNHCKPEISGFSLLRLLSMDWTISEELAKFRMPIEMRWPIKLYWFSIIFNINFIIFGYQFI